MVLLGAILFMLLPKCAKYVVGEERAGKGSIHSMFFQALASAWVSCEFELSAHARRSGKRPLSCYWHRENKWITNSKYTDLFLFTSLHPPMAYWVLEYHIRAHTICRTTNFTCINKHILWPLLILSKRVNQARHSARTTRKSRLTA